METKQMSFLAAAKDFFGLKPQQTAIQFLQETKALTEADKVEIKEGPVKQGYSIV